MSGIVSLGQLAVASLRARRLNGIITLLSIALAIMLSLLVARISDSVRSSFDRSINGAHLIVGARTSPTGLLLNSIFHVGDATDDMRQSSARWITDRPEVAWAIPLAFGDSYRGFRVVGTSNALFDHAPGGAKQPLRFADGRGFGSEAGVVIGATAAQDLRLKIGDSIIVDHGHDAGSTEQHGAHPFRVTGILEATGTALDRALFIELKSYGLMHARNGQLDMSDARLLNAQDLLARYRDQNRDEAQISALILGLHDPADAIGLRRMINDWSGEPLTAILPAQTLAELWTISEAAEAALRALTIIIFLMAMLTVLAGIAGSAAERRREMAVLRAVGMGRNTIIGLLMLEAAALVLAGAALGGIFAAITLSFIGRMFAAWTGLSLGPFGVGTAELGAIVLLLTIALAASASVGLGLYRRTVADGLTPQS